MRLHTHRAVRTMSEGPALFQILLSEDVMSLHEQLWIAMDVVREGRAGQ